MIRCISLFGTVLVMGLLAALGGCEKKTEAPVAGKPAATPPAAVKHDDHDHAAGEAHDDHGHGAAAELGSATIGGFTVKVTQEGAVVEGAESAFEIAVSGGTGKPSAIRGWIGVEDASGSVKGKAEVEGEGFHLHAEAPKPLAAGAKLWIEIEDAKGAKALGSFDLKR